jgi:hypothetical protein
VFAGELCVQVKLCVQASCKCKCVVRRLVVCARGLYVKVGCGCRCVVCLGGVCVQVSYVCAMQ